MTERREAKPAVHRVSSVELRLYIVALLALVYTAAWRTLTAETRATTSTPAATDSRLVRSSQRAPDDLRTTSHPRLRVRTRSS